MGTYASLSDVQDQFGTANVAAWSDLSANDTLDTDRVDRAIARAEARVNDRFRGSKWTMPFAPVPSAVQSWAAVLAGVLLYRHRGIRDTDAEERIAALEERVESEMNQVLSGTATLDADTLPRAPFVVA